ncbi:MAG: putative undecaprenyl-phosphate N-acetylglucosaminyl 1-phosphate transferase [Fimbriimonadaceae bacterium]|nr:putative undecaprenyl-phosphate N-acetylglucosaminyl 1-phosphate transferase [Fimbriimonadaceae bacterium]
MNVWLAATEGRWLDGFRAPLLAAAVALLVSWLLTPQVRRLAIQRGAMDDPNQDERRIHKNPLPRWGGLAIYGGLTISLLAVLPFAFPQRPFPMYLIGILLLGAVIVVVGAMDDLYQYKAKIQALFLLAIGVAIQFIFDDKSRIQISGIATPLFSDSRTWQDFGWIAIPVTAIYIFVITKTMDTIDGVDGLASGIAAISGATLSVIATYEGQPRVALVAAALAGSAIGFLRHNYNPAKIILGTGGSQLLGFVLACLSIVGAMKTAAAVAIFVPVLAFGIPIIDAIQVIFRRLKEGQPLTQGDKRHLHHQLLHRGLSQRQTVWVLYVAALALCGALLVVVRLYG